MILALPFPMIDPVALSLGPFVVRWYALAYVAGILLGWRYAIRLCAIERLWGAAAAVSRQELDDFVLWATLGIVLGGRIGYVVFYNLDFYLGNPLEILKVWQGGMSFHGGLIGVMMAILLFARRSGLPALVLSDIVTAAAPIGLFFGRIANFANAELWGRTTDIAWAFVFPGAGPEGRHPSQLYEAALEGVVLFCLLWFATHAWLALKRPGVVTGLFIAGYGVFRFLVEFFREPDAHIGFLPGGLTMGMVLSLPMLVIGLIAIVWAVRR